MLDFNKRRYIKVGAVLGSTIFLFIADRILKYWELNFLYNQRVEIIKGWVSLDLFKNKDIAFSLPVSQFIAVPAIVLIICLLIYYFIKSAQQGFGPREAVLLLIIFGAAGNLFDRLRYGYVIDYINFSFWPVFNLADAMIGGGTAAMIVLLLKKNK
ncbi:signal peptidase II [Candidatus Falkowbacteria bacterium CG10_big_fil_rev_8_21_14_0_10_43_10]|uniref:Lipoprotein signal peptidase n=1 Tax=Candidatus Falkowbacteria bacterium CG10_big_fil_rev_8_21_14_0_10_43_10 TaxID=1974567 RepID=A0A2H0V282_9BACT|nr:MAG: signal peptidase II [Candidatus Falkowbacteria bacterium CG10_big_fil_rev_8_21_14_0_10_43_10]